MGRPMHLRGERARLTDAERVALRALRARLGTWQAVAKFAHVDAQLLDNLAGGAPATMAPIERVRAALAREGGAS